MQPTRTPLNTEFGFASSAPKMARGMMAWVAMAAAPPRMDRRVSRVSWLLRVIVLSLKKVFQTGSQSSICRSICSPHWTNPTVITPADFEHLEAEYDG